MKWSLGSRRLGRQLVCGITTVTVAAAVIGCGSSDDSQDTTAADAATTPVKKGPAATKSPIAVGMMSMELIAGGSDPEVSDAERAAVRYINEELGGVDGHPINLDVCLTDGTPETSQKCANQLVDKKPALITAGVDLGTKASLPIFDAAGLSYVGGFPLQGTELVAPNTYFFVGGPPASQPVEAQFLAQTLKAKKVAVIHYNDPGATGLTENFFVPVLEKNGVKVTQYAVPVSNADWTPSLSAAKASGPDVIAYVGGPTSCPPLIKTKQQLAIDKPLMTIQLCAGTSITKEAGAAAEGMYSAIQHLVDPADPDYKLFLDKYGRYHGKNYKISQFSQVGFQTIMNVYDLMKKIGGDAVTPAAINKALKATDGQKNFMSAPYTCDGKQLTGLRAICNANNRIVQWKDGKFVDLSGKWESGAEALK